jgi:DNA-binding HxlR family transcriptional regulator
MGISLYNDSNLVVVRGLNKQASFSGELAKRIGFAQSTLPEQLRNLRRNGTLFLTDEGQHGAFFVS